MRTFTGEKLVFGAYMLGQILISAKKRFRILIIDV